MCVLKKIPYKFNFNRITFHPDVIWVSNVLQLKTLKISQDDDVFYGFKFSDFKADEQAKIQAILGKRKPQ